MADKKTLTVQLDNELYEFFSRYAKDERDSMAGLLRKHVLELKKQHEQQAETFYHDERVRHEGA